MTPPTRRLVALPLLGIAITLAAFGVIRGVASTGPASGMRLTVAIEPPVDEAARTLAQHVARARLDEKGLPVRVVPAGDHLVIELATDDPEIVRAYADILERTAKVEAHLAGPAGAVVLAGRAIRRAEVLDQGVAIEVDAPGSLAAISPGASLAFTLDGTVRMTAVADRVVGTEIHVRTPGTTDDASLESATQLVDLLEAGAAHAMHVRKQAPFSRATGFFPRAWPFFAIAGGFLVVVLILMRRR